ncbi:MAG: LysR family transcriptional regulator [Angustibacter sp.]
MDLALLRAFVHVSETCSITEAAARLGYSQPGLSQRIQALERRLGCRLFDRVPHGVVLTPTGVAMLPYARIMLGVEQAMHDEVARARRTAGLPLSHPEPGRTA